MCSQYKCEMRTGKKAKSLHRRFVKLLHRPSDSRFTDHESRTRKTMLAFAL